MRDEWLANGPANVQDAIAGLILGPGYDPSPWFAKWAAAPKEHLALPYQCLVERDDITPRLGKIVCPAIIFHGAEDHSIELDRAEVMRDALPGCVDLIVVPGAGHASNLTHPDHLNPPLAEFLRKYG
jgi:pimeloyl-ACP methyl ester carboxylesterase